jgi:Heparinase II/III-like protein
MKLLISLLLLTFSHTILSQNWIKLDTKIPNHPRILWLDGQLQATKRHVSSDSTLQSVHQIILKECNSLLSKPVSERVLKGRRLLEVSSESFRRIFFLSYAWRMTQEAKYYKRAEAELLAVCAFADWNPSHFLDVADMTTGVAIGYDWLHTALSESSKVAIKNAIIEKGLKPSLDVRYNEWLTAKTNWNQVCNAGMTLGAIAIFESDPKLASDIINRAIATVPLAMKEYDPDGNYPEGYGYWGYGTTRNVILLSALSQAFQSDFGLTEKKGFLKTPYYLLNMTGPSGHAFNYSDNHAKGVLNPAMVWFADKLKDPTLLFEERKHLRKNRNLHRIQELPALLIWGTYIDWEKIQAPAAKTFSDKGANPVAMLRTSWKIDGIFVGLKAGSPYVNHGHMDVGEFVFDALGERWAMDFDPESYSGIEAAGIDLWNKKQASTRWRLFRLNNNGHSTLTINNQPQQVKGVAHITQTSSNPEFLNAIADLTPVYNTEVKKALRGVAILKNNTVLVQDEIEATTKPASIRWKMLTAAQVVLKNETTAELTINNKKMIVKVIAPTACRLVTWATKPETEFEEDNEGTQMLGFDYTVAAGATATFSVLISPNGISVPTTPLVKWPKN